MLTDDGIIVLNKPTQMSSNKAVQIVKHILKPNKIGHMGTLDPLGSGVLILGINKSTKLFDKFLSETKTYRAIFYFGKETDTLDSEGMIIRTIDCDITIDQVNAVCKKFIGKFEQMPPLYSAKKVNGKKAYELARKGEYVKLKTRLIEIYDIKCINEIKRNTFMFEITCSGGTYIRSICRDMATELSTCGTMLAIVRTRCGKYDISESCTIEDIKNDNFKLLNAKEGEIL